MKIPLRILIVEDSEDDAFLEIHHIEKGNYKVEYEIVQTAESFMKTLNGKVWDVVLCDYKMPRFNGFEALKIFKQSGPDIPFIIISGTIGEEFAVECMKAGADDYLIKGNLVRLIPAIERGMREAKNRADRKRLEIEQKQSESELRFRNILLSTQQEVSIDGILVVDEGGKIISCNRNYITMWNIPPEVFESKSADLVLQSVLGNLAEPEEYVRKVKYLYEQKKETSRDEIPLKDGRTFDRYSAPMFGPDNKYYGRVWFFRDITESKRAEEEIKRTEAKRFELERELIQSQKLESLGTLASGIAHDFNNILAIILGYASLGEQGALTHQPDLVKCFETISLASRRGALLVSQLLTFARKTETVFRSTDLNALIVEMTRLFGETFPKTIVISTNLEKDIPGVVADVTQLHQVFMNLCVNARDAMPTGGTITIATRVLDGVVVKSKFPKAASQRYLEISVSDTGSGMTEITKRKIFDPFFTTKEPGKGTGLGLALVQSIIENHHGMIGVESELGIGTTFHLYLPIEKSAPDHVEPESPVPESASRGTETVLLIEDEVSIIDMVRTVLSSKGYVVLHARDGEEGVAKYSRQQKDIAAVLLDFGLPKLRGDAVANRIKAINPNAKIILMSGIFGPDIKTNMTKIGVNHFIQKPFSFAELTSSLRSAIDAKV
ncbi:MAG TPA: response regulator [Fibrobacteria bacterium]|nr:response regulator [Fibrobacteria bacterium]